MGKFEIEPKRMEEVLGGYKGKEGKFRYSHEMNATG